MHFGGDCRILTRDGKAKSLNANILKHILCGLTALMLSLQNWSSTTQHCQDKATVMEIKIIKKIRDILMESAISLKKDIIFQRHLKIRQKKRIYVPYNTGIHCPGPRPTIGTDCDF